MTSATVPQQTIEQWLSATLRGDTTLTRLAPGGVHVDRAPGGKDDWPVVVYFSQSAKTIRPAGTEVIGEETFYGVKGIDKARSYTKLWDVAQRLLDLLDNATAAPGSDRFVFRCQKVTLIKFLEQEQGGPDFVHLGHSYIIYAR